MSSFNSRTFVFIWLIMYLPTYIGALQLKIPCQQEGYCVTFNEDEIRAEAGLCAVIPCSFKSLFAPEHIIWYKCEKSEDNCDKSVPVFHSDKNEKNIQPMFKGRVLLLNLNMTEKNCSMVINDLQKSDSGSYQLRVVGKGTGEAFTYLVKANLSLADLNQKPSVMIPPLTEGQQASLTCTAPGLCSGSPPKITWMWRGEGEKDSYIIGNITALKTENLTAFTKRHVSTLTFNASADHHNTSITCKVNFIGYININETVTLNVTYARKPQISGRSKVKEGNELNLNCSVDSFPPSVITWTKSRKQAEQQSHNVSKKCGSSKICQRQKISCLFSITNVTTEDAGLYICTAKHLNNTQREKITVTVTYARKPQISGRTTVMEGDNLNLTCSVDSVPPSVIKWTKSGIETKWQDNILSKAESRQVYLLEKSGRVSFSFMNVTTEEAGCYICTATYRNESMTEEVHVKVTYVRKPQISGRTTVMEGEDLNLTCSVDSVPPSVITWTKYGTEINCQDNILSKADNSTVVYGQEKSGNVSVSIMNVTAKEAGCYICTATYENDSMIENIHVKVNYLRKPRISGRTTVKEGDDLNLTCGADSFPLSDINWTKTESKTHQQHSNSSSAFIITENTKRKDGNGSLSKTNVTAEDARLYICTAKHLTNNLTEQIKVTVTYDFKNATVEEDLLNLNCSVDSFQPLVVRWTKSGTEASLKIDSLSKAFTVHVLYELANVPFPITNETMEDAERYICTATYQNSTMEEKIDIVTNIRKPQISVRTTADEEEALNPTCTVDSFSSSVINLTIFEKSNLQIKISMILQNSSENLKQEHSGMNTLFINSVKAKDAGLYICTAKVPNITLTEEINVTVTYRRRPQIIGSQTIKEGDALNLTCSVDSVPPSLIVWTKNSLSILPSNRTSSPSNNGSTTLVVFNMTVKDSGRYICTITYENITETKYIDINVTWSPKVLNGSGCVLRPDGLTCVCLSAGFPLPTIQWPLLKDHTEYSITSIVSNHTVNSTVTITVENHGNISVECVSSNENGEAKKNLTVLWAKEEVSKQTTNSEKKFMLEIIIAFLVGFLLAPIICCLLMKFYRIKWKNSADEGESLEMVTPLMSNGQAVQGREKKEALAGTPEATNGPKELMYARIDFSLLNRIPTKRIKSSENKNTEYAEIKANKENAHQVEMMTEEDSEMKNCVQEVKEEAEEPVYAKVEDLVEES
ncbi:hemicentin-1-like isoform X1 [Xiphophorus couchianus]|uniref:hemicentin-1-like isoform X1 n=1 Tax=Xiphophorus couchianus TaxID=32473 RepID=UPI001015FB5B|nr:hemicentin-1-like isoform X1 [Xiphophorus couchianus]